MALVHLAKARGKGIKLDKQKTMRLAALKPKIQPS